jgi:DNA-binding LacI/PurR family transcriptional regulator
VPTIRDVASAAGVGLGTVSRVLADSPLVAPETRARVQDAIRRLGYRPSAVARALRRGRSDTVEVITPLFTRYFYVEVLRGVQAALSATERALVVRSVARRRDRDLAFADPGSRGRADGVLIVSLRPTAGLLERLAAASLPAVLVDGEHPRLPSVWVDHTAAAALAVEHLLRLGHRRVALVDHAEDPFAPTYPEARGRGYRRALVRAGLAPLPGYELVTGFGPEEAASALERLLALPEPPTAVFAGSDAQAVGVLDAARRRGLRVPEELSVCGYNDVELAQHIGLTTVRLPMYELGRRGAALLLEALERPSTPRASVDLPVELVVRRTTGPPPTL